MDWKEHIQSAMFYVEWDVNRRLKQSVGQWVTSLFGLAVC